MKMQNMKIVQKWREYAGPKDERLEAENAKIYEFGFILLSFGMLALLAYEIIAQQVAWVHNGANDAFHLFASPVDAAMYAWLFIVMLICAVLQTRKGYVDTNRFGQTDHLPAGYFLLIAGITGATSALAIAAMRCIAEAQIVPFEDIFWAANLATGVVFGVTIFAATFGALCLAFYEAKHRRAKSKRSLTQPTNANAKSRARRRRRTLTQKLPKQKRSRQRAALLWRGLLKPPLFRIRPKEALCPSVHTVLSKHGFPCRSYRCRRTRQAR